MTGSGLKRGALIVFEGCDKVGKTTQCRMLVEALRVSGVTAELIQFPDRTTATGGIISKYLAQKEELSDQAIHLLFSANRWESQPKMQQLLQKGVTLVIDRYSFSGVAYSAAKPGMEFDWCCKPEIGLPKPDLVFLLYVPTDATKSRSGFGEERYENKEFLQHVYSNYLKLKDKTWMLIEASKSVDELHKELVLHSKEVIKKAEMKELQTLW